MMGDLVARGVVVAIDCDPLDAEPLEGDYHFLAQLAGAEQHHSRSPRGQWCTDACWFRCCAHPLIIHAPVMPAPLRKLTSIHNPISSKSA